MNPDVLDKAVQDFINEHIKEDAGKIALSKSPFKTVSSKELAQQIDAKKRSEKKLPSWFKTPGIYFPSKLNIEQCSSEIAAEYKSKLAEGETLIDLTGGFGVDSFYFAKRISTVYHCEIDPLLAEIAAYNAKKLNADNITFVPGNGPENMENLETTFDTIYIDPSRRVKSQKVFLLKDCEPDVITCLDFLLSKTEKLIIKTSPVYDIQAGLKELKNVKEVHVISIKNDCKELIWILEKDIEKEAEIVAATYLNNEFETLRFKLSEEKATEIEYYTAPQAFLYEPDSAVLKAGCFKLLTSRLPVEKLHPNTHLYTSLQFVENFPGRKFKIRQTFSYKDFAGNNQTKKANIICRNFPNSPEEVKKKFKINDGGESYLIFAIGSEGKPIVIEAERV